MRLRMVTRFAMLVSDAAPRRRSHSLFHPQTTTTLVEGFHPNRISGRQASKQAGKFADGEIATVSSK